eukprot:SAG31_NODE_8138_length_1513_cov_2.591938_2_plen_42_part_01
MRGSHARGPSRGGRRPYVDFYAARSIRRRGGGGIAIVIARTP